jgi:transcriptional regulator with XRE-family HTH domain
MRTPDGLDSLIGQNIRRHREQRGVTQAGLGAAVGVTFQQIQKYELGKNRIAASRLYRIAWVLGVPIEAFFKAERR